MNEIVETWLVAFAVAVFLLTAIVFWANRSSLHYTSAPPPPPTTDSDYVVTGGMHVVTYGGVRYYSEFGRTWHTADGFRVPSAMELRLSDIVHAKRLARQIRSLST